MENYFEKQFENAFGGLGVRAQVSNLNFALFLEPTIVNRLDAVRFTHTRSFSDGEQIAKIHSSESIIRRCQQNPKKSLQSTIIPVWIGILG
jgi:hypothetical protein